MQTSFVELKRLSSDKTILIVEDDLDLLENLRRLLAHFFKSIHTASDVDNALDIFEKIKRCMLEFGFY